MDVLGLFYCVAVYFHVIRFCVWYRAIASVYNGVLCFSCHAGQGVGLTTNRTNVRLFGCQNPKKIFIRGFLGIVTFFVQLFDILKFRQFFC